VLKSKYRFNGDHTSLLIIGLLAVGGTLKFILDPNSFKSSSQENKIIFGLLVVGIGFLYCLYMVLKIPRIFLSQNSIILTSVFKTKKIFWNDIQSITLTGKTNRGILMNPAETVILNLKNNSKVLLWIEYYSNQQEIRLALEKINESLTNNQLPTEITQFTQKKYESIPDIEITDFFEKYSGNPHTSFRGLLFYLFLAGMIAIALSGNHKPLVSLILLIPVTAVYFGLGFQLHYFLLSDKYLVIKNHFWVWRKHTYYIDDIREIIFERPYRWSNTLRIITKEFKDKSYPAGSLSKKPWNDLISRLQSLKISIRKEF
jgi:hypothetical protein